MKIYRNEKLKAIGIDIRGSIAGLMFPCWAEIKFDGEYTWLRKVGNKTYTLNKYGLQRTDFPLTERASALSEHDFTLIGELYYGDGKLGALHNLSKNKTDHGLNFYAFDIYSFGSLINNNKTSMPFISRAEIMMIDFGLTRRGKLIESEEELQKYFKETIAQGYEGIVAKNLNDRLMLGTSNWVKMKEKTTSEFKVTYIDPVKDRIEVEVVSINVLGKKTIRQIGCKCMPKKKAELKIGDKVKIEYQGILAMGGLRFPVYKGKVGGEYKGII